MPNVRATKQHVYNPISGYGAYLFDALDQITLLPPITSTIIASAVSTTVQAVIGLPQRCCIVKINLQYSTGAAFDNAVDKFNIVMGGGAEAGTTPAAQTVGTAGQSVFAADKVIGGSASVNYQSSSYIPDVPEAVWDTSAVMTLRFVTTAAAGTHLLGAAATPITCTLLVAYIDPKPMVSSANPSTDF